MANGIQLIAIQNFQSFIIYFHAMHIQFAVHLDGGIKLAACLLVQKMEKQMKRNRNLNGFTVTLVVLTLTPFVSECANGLCAVPLSNSYHFFYHSISINGIRYVCVYVKQHQQSQ